MSSKSKKKRKKKSGKSKRKKKSKKSSQSSSSDVDEEFDFEDDSSSSSSESDGHISADFVDESSSENEDKEDDSSDKDEDDDDMEEADFDEDISSGEDNDGAKLGKLDAFGFPVVNKKLDKPIMNNAFPNAQKEPKKQNGFNFKAKRDEFGFPIVDENNLKKPAPGNQFPDTKEPEKPTQAQDFKAKRDEFGFPIVPGGFKVEEPQPQPKQQQPQRPKTEAEKNTERIKNNLDDPNAFPDAAEDPYILAKNTESEVKTLRGGTQLIPVIRICVWCLNIAQPTPGCKDTTCSHCNKHFCHACLATENPQGTKVWKGCGPGGLGSVCSYNDPSGGYKDPKSGRSDVHSFAIQTRGNIQSWRNGRRR